MHPAKTQISIWTTAWQNQQTDLCTQQSLRSAWASTQSDQSLRWALSGKLSTQCFFMWTATTLKRLGVCPGWSESLLGTEVILLVLSGGSLYVWSDLIRTNDVCMEKLWVLGYLKSTRIEPPHDKMTVHTAKTDQPGHLPSLIRVFAVHSKDS